MKIFKYMILVLLSFFMFNTTIMAASSKFEPTINMEPEIVNNQLQIIMGFKGEEVMALNHFISWDSKYLTFVDIYPLEEFVVTKGEIKEDGDYRTIELVADSNTAFSDNNYALLVFDIDDSFKKGKRSDVIYYTYEGANYDKSRVRHIGVVQTLIRETSSSMGFLLNTIDDNTRLKYWFLENYMLIVFGALIVLAFIVVILSIPSKRRKEAREKNIREQTKGDKTLDEYQEIVPIKIDMEEISSIGEEKKEVDMSEAIIVSDYQPFENNPSRVSDTNIQGFKDIVSGAQSEEVSEEVSEVKQEEVLDAFNRNIVVDAETITVTSDTKFEDKKQEKIETLGTEVKIPENDVFVELKDNEEGLMLFQPTEFDKKEDNDSINFNNIIIFLLLVLTLLTPLSIKALDGNEVVINSNIDNIRNCIVGNISFDSSYDLNDDGKCDVMDIIYTKDLVNINNNLEDNME